MPMMLIMAALFFSCGKPDYNPEKRILKIYTEQDSKIWNGYDRYFYSRTPKKLVEVWKWDKKKLIRIESDAWPMDFIYEKNRLLKITSGEDEFLFDYDEDGKLSSLKLYYDKLFAAEFIMNEYQNGQVTKLTYSQYRDLEKSQYKQKNKSLLRLFFPPEMSDILTKSANSKSFYKATIELTYQGENVITQKLIEEATDFEITYCYTYHSSLNPYYFAFHELSGIEYPLVFSKNNISTSYNKEIEEDILRYYYELEENWPTKKTIENAWSYEWHDRPNDTILLIENYERNYEYYEYE